MNSKNKGNTFERKVANLLSETFKPHTGLEKAFTRAVDSGSFFGGSNNRRLETHDTSRASFGDIVCPMDFIYTVECKHYKTPPSLAAWIKQEVGQWDTWLGQAEQDAQSAGRKPLLLVKYNNVPEIVFLKDDVDVKSIGRYKEWSIYRLTDILALPISHFFDA